MKGSYEGHIRPATPEDRAAWQALWDAYLIFYEAEIPPEHHDLLWRRISDLEDPIECLLAEGDNGDPIGLVHFFPHPDTWRDRPVCYLQDLYVNDEKRGQGIGESLIRAVEARCKEDGWALVYWQTAEDNQRARRLYDKLAGEPTRFVIYELEQT